MDTRSEAVTAARKGRAAVKPHSKPDKDNHKQATAIASLGIVADWSQYPELKELGFSKLIEKRLQLKEEMEFRKAKLDQLDQEIQAALAVAGTEKVTWQDRPVQIVHSRSASKIVAEKLLERGVAASVIAESTEPGKEYQYLLVGRPKE